MHKQQLDKGEIVIYSTLRIPKGRFIAAAPLTILPDITVKHTHTHLKNNNKGTLTAVIWVFALNM